MAEKKTTSRGRGSTTKRSTTKKASTAKKTSTAKKGSSSNAGKRQSGRGSRSTTADSGSKRTSRARAKEAAQSKHFSQARTRAQRLLHDADATEKLVDEAEKRTDGRRAGKLKKVMNELKAMLRLVRAYAKGDYRAVSWESMVLIVAALIYLVSPIDLIPDFLPAGLADDATVILFVVGLVHEELQDFTDWEDTRDDDGAAGVRVPA